MAVSQATPLEGTWSGRFAGVGLVVSGDQADLFQVSESFSWPLGRFTVDGNGFFDTGDGRRYRLIARDGRLDMLDDRDGLFLSFLPTAALPRELAPTGDPGTVFDVFWESFAENHALFDLVVVDWAANRTAWRAQAADAATPAALFDVLAGFLAPLEDRHTTLVRPETGEIFRAGRPSDAFWSGRENEFLANLERHYLDAPLRTRGADPRLRFGFLPGGVGYLSVSNFLDSPSLPPYAVTLDRVLDELETAPGLVVDLRFNRGGVDRNALAFLERVLSPSVDVAWVRERRLSGALPPRFDPPEPQFLAPRDNGFHRKPLAVLTANDTASAAEAVLLALLDRPRVVQLGERTAGVFSNLLVRYLPNGWYATLSNERFNSPGGVFYEQQGIPPQRPVDRAAYDFVRGVDPAVDASLVAIAAQPADPGVTISPGAGLTGLWYDPQRSGEGWHLQRLDETRVLASLYAFDPDGSGAPDWVLGVGEERDGVLVLDELFTARGGRFGAGPEDPPIEIQAWGSGEIAFSGCSEAVATLSGPDSHRGFTFRLRPLTRVPGLACGPSGVVPSPSLAGSWYVPERPGEGWLVSPASNGSVVVTWYTFDEAGRRHWRVGLGEVDAAGVLRVPELVVASGAAWGHDFVISAVDRSPAGRLSLRLDGCRRAEIEVEQQGSRTRYPVQRLSFVAGLDYPGECD